MRKHPGVVRPPVEPKADDIVQDMRVDRCPDCGGALRDCARINKRLVNHRFDVLLFLERSDVPPDNNLGERDIRSVAATRADGGVNRTKSGAEAFAKRKSIARTCRKHGRNFIEYAPSLIGLDEKHEPLPFTLQTELTLNSS